MRHRRVLRYAVTAALAGLLFGFDTVVISGADQSLEALFNRGEYFHGFVIMGAALWGTVVGALTGGIPTDRLGRKTTLVAIGVLYVVSAVGSALATGPYVFAVLRFVGGLGVGASTVAAPAYVSEIAPPERRGRLVALYQFNIVTGILLAFGSNYLLSGVGGEDAWRWMLGVEAIPAAIYTALALGLPRSPRWLVSNRRDFDGAARILRDLDPDVDAEAAVAGMQPDDNQLHAYHTLLSPRYRRSVWLTIAIAAFNQFSGINAFLYYAPRIFELAGLEARSALLSTIGIGAVNLAFTLVGLALIDRVGRRTLMYAGSVGYVVSLSLVAAAFYFEWPGAAVPIFLFVFIAAHAVGQGTVIWVFIAEIFPNHLRGKGQALGSSVHWVLAALIPSLMPVLVVSLGPTAVFAFFAVMMVGQLIWVAAYMPETRGVPLETLETELQTS